MWKVLFSTTLLCCCFSIRRIQNNRNHIASNYNPFDNYNLIRKLKLNAQSENSNNVIDESTPFTLTGIAYCDSLQCAVPSRDFLQGSDIVFAGLSMIYYL
jgi:hypothetical protein